MKDECRKRRLLGADTPVGVAMLRGVFAGSFDVIPVHTLDAAVARLRGDLDLILCGLHFDDSRMFDLLRLAKATPATREIPFICYRDLDTQLARPILEGMEIAAKANGALTFVDTFTLKQQAGTARADERFRAIVLQSVRSS